MKKKKLGEVLRDRGKISPSDLLAAITEQQGKVIHLGELMLERGLVTKHDLGAALEEVSHIPYIDCTTVAPEARALRLVPRAMAERLCVLPIRCEQRSLVVAMAAPQNLAILDELRFSTSFEISPRLSFRSELQQAIDRHYASSDGQSFSHGTLHKSDRIKFEEVEFISTSSRQANQEAIREMQADATQRRTPAVRLVSEMLQVAMARRASDIHIEPRAADTAVRMRVDGVLRDHQLIPRAFQTSLISRVKILADMDISERRAPQDGRFMVAIRERQIDLRVSTLPTQYGEKVVIRLLETSAPLTSYADLGMPENISLELSEMLSAPQGMILVTGPTGSGKSTTLYSSLDKLRRPSVNIVTVEDPVEYVLPGINQAHVNTKAGMTFASCLRSILRQDPNIIMVGEIRDKETAEIAMRAAQTGHLVLSTMHTNDSVSAIVRLLDLGIPGYLIGSSLTGILAQRLVRKLCSCHSVEKAAPDFRARLMQLGVSNPPSKMALPRGCDKCDQSGYIGRIGIYELLNVDDSVRDIIRANGNIDQIRDTSRANGMTLMREDALEKLLEGVTTLEEILRVIPMESVKGAECAKCSRPLLQNFNFCPSCGAPCGRDSFAPRAGKREFTPEGAF
ncbi:MAG: Flp pilus assembly complex ATPase component TadA [Acidobacteriia bacterium]|nr:Flp pilus assembly complex ATPase component TadA [Terriglobia bacterium]